MRASLRRPKCEKAVKTERGGANRFGEARGSGMQSRRSLLCYKHRWDGKLDGGAATISRNMRGETPDEGGGLALLLFRDLAKVEFLLVAATVWRFWKGRQWQPSNQQSITGSYGCSFGSITGGPRLPQLVGWK